MTGLHSEVGFVMTGKLGFRAMGVSLNLLLGDRGLAILGRYVVVMTTYLVNRKLFISAWKVVSVSWVGL